MFLDEEQNFETIKLQYRILADLDFIKSYKNENIRSFWHKIFAIKLESNQYIFEEVIKVVRGILSISHSYANVVRIKV